VENGNKKQKKDKALDERSKGNEDGAGGEIRSKGNWGGGGAKGGQA